jgi:2-oxoglutarate/2-oxoacid ferredoxin oxidoreductase subunit beta
MGVFRDVARPTYDGLMAAQLDHTLTKDASDTAALDALLHGKDAWTIA